MLSISSLDLRTREVLESILLKSPETLSVEECTFLKARRDYLSSDQMAYFGKAMESKSVEVVSAEATPKVEKSMKVLLKASRKLGIELPDDLTPIQIQAMITEKEMELEAAEEDKRLKEEADVKAELEKEEKAKAEKSHVGNFTNAEKFDNGESESQED